MEQDFDAQDHRQNPWQQNRAEPLFNLPRAITASIMLLFAVQGLIAVGTYLAPGSQFIPMIYFYGGFIPLRYDYIGTSGDLSWIWTPLTYSFLHGGWEHLIFNSVWLAIFGSPVARRIGTIRFILLWVVLAVLSALAFYAFNSQSEGLLVGASGVISGFTGAACRFAWPSPAASRRGAASNGLLSYGEVLTNRTVLTFVVFWFVANVVFAAYGSAGTGQAIAWEAHLGGFIAGFFLFPMFDRKPTHRAQL